MYLSLEIRQTASSDLPILHTLLNELKESFLEDWQLEAGVSMDILTGALADNELSTIGLSALGEFHPVGCIWMEDIHPAKLHGIIHLALRPEWMRLALKTNLFPRAMTYIFDTYGIGKIKARPMRGQSTAISLLQRLGFYFGAAERDEAVFKGRKTAVIPCELTRKYWSRNSELRKKEKKQQQQRREKDPGSVDPQAVQQRVWELQQGDLYCDRERRPAKRKAGKRRNS